MVKLYTNNSCHWCLEAKSYLKSQAVEFEELNIQENRDAAQEMVTKSGQVGVPVLDIDNEIIVGFDKEAIDTALNL